MDFLLKKYYMDLVTPQGDVVLCYASELKLGVMTIRHASVLCVEQGKEVKSFQTFTRGVMPTLEGSHCHWHCSCLKVRGEWEAMMSPVEAQCLYEAEPGKDIIWQCLMPRAKGRIILNNQCYEGEGYVECLTMRLEPWNLPMKQLEWGRFHGVDGETCVWIRWSKGRCLSLFIQGNNVKKGCKDLDIREDGKIMTGNHFGMVFEESQVLRHGDISKTALRYLPKAAKMLLPQSILHLEETKWLSKTFFTTYEKNDHGYSIHEIVKF